MELAAGGWAILVSGALAAGWVDAVIGGGGLIAVPLMLAVCPSIPLATALATCKLAAFSGTASAAFTMARKIRPPLHLVAPLVAVALVGAGSGALLVSHVDKQVMRPIVIVLLLAAGTFVALKPSFGTAEHDGPFPAFRRRLITFAIVAGIAFYDGIFGPGTGMFLIMVFTGLFVRNFLTSAAMAKVVNTATNFGALMVFIFGGHMWWTVGIVLALANITGAQLGARTVIAGGTKLIRYALLALVVVMSIYLTFQQFQVV